MRGSILRGSALSHKRGESGPGSCLWGLSERGWSDQRPSALLALCVSLTCLSQSPARASAEEVDDRGAKGVLLSTSFGGYGGAGTGVSGESLGWHTGTSGSLMIAEEVIPRLTIGLGSEFYFGNTSDNRYEVSIFSLSLEGRWRLSSALRGLTLSVAVGIGGGGFTPASGQPPSVEEASGGGGLLKAGVGYELGSSNPGGFSFTPRLTYQRLGAQMGSEVSADLLSLGLEVAWESGR